MQYNKYKEIIEKTAVYPTKVDDFGLAYCTLGLVEETGEFIEKLNGVLILGDSPELLIKEAGDVMWYTTALNLYFKQDIEKMINDIDKRLKQVDMDYDTNPVTDLAGQVKKHYRDGKEISEIVPIFNKYLKYMLSVFKHLEYIIPKFKMDHILSKNYEKLMKRRETNTLHGDGDNREEG